MIPYSSAFKQELAKGNRRYKIHLVITFENGSTIDVFNDQIWEGTFSIEDATSTSGNLDVGTFSASKLKCTLNNMYGDFDEYDFYMAKIGAYVGLDLEDGTTEYELVGNFTVDNPQYNGSTISISANDNFYKFNQFKFDDCPVDYPITTDMLVASICDYVDCDYVSPQLSYSYTIESKPSDGFTCAQMISFIAQIHGKFAKIDRNGRLYFKWYALPSTEIDPQFEIDSTFALNTYTSDLSVTGVRVECRSKESDYEVIPYLAGSEGYVVEISNNPLISTNAQAQEVALLLKENAFKSFVFRPLNGTILSDPSIESGDSGTIMDWKGVTYKFFVSTRSFKVGNSESISCDAETPLTKTQNIVSPTTNSVVYAKQLVANEKSERKTAEAAMEQQIRQAGGFYVTKEGTPETGEIWYMHNKQLLSDSTIVWKITAETMSVCTDYDQPEPHWNASLNADGIAILQRIYANGIILGGTGAGVNGYLKCQDIIGNDLVTLDKNGLTLGKNQKIKFSNVEGRGYGIDQNNILQYNDFSANKQRWHSDYVWGSEASKKLKLYKVNKATSEISYFDVTDENINTPLVSYGDSIDYTEESGYYKYFSMEAENKEDVYDALKIKINEGGGRNWVLSACHNFVTRLPIPGEYVSISFDARSNIENTNLYLSVPFSFDSAGTSYRVCYSNFTLSTEWKRFSYTSDAISSNFTIDARKSLCLPYGTNPAYELMSPFSFYLNDSHSNPRPTYEISHIVISYSDTRPEYDGTWSPTTNEIEYYDSSNQLQKWHKEYDWKDPWTSKWLKLDKFSASISKADFWANSKTPIAVQGDVIDYYEEGQYEYFSMEAENKEGTYDALMFKPSGTGSLWTFIPLPYMKKIPKKGEQMTIAFDIKATSNTNGYVVLQTDYNSETKKFSVEYNKFDISTSWTRVVKTLTIKASEEERDDSTNDTLFKYSLCSLMLNGGSSVTFTISHIQVNFESSQAWNPYSVNEPTLEDSITEITKNTITVDYLNAKQIVAGSVDCENLTGTVISGKTLYGGYIEQLSTPSVTSNTVRLKMQDGRIIGTYGSEITENLVTSTIMFAAGNGGLNATGMRLESTSDYTNGYIDLTADAIALHCSKFAVATSPDANPSLAYNGDYT
ncbi:MAG: hypothetical protein HUK23_02140, partial [Sphaerochaetaceae bacterium]|nr:hypothetical protein [Sphaerochaetaceae bacterium]